VVIDNVCEEIGHGLSSPCGDDSMREKEKQNHVMTDLGDDNGMTETNAEQSALFFARDSCQLKQRVQRGADGCRAAKLKWKRVALGI